MAESLEGRVALVTGASSGIGLAIARELHRRGATVTIAARSAERLEAAAATIGERCTPMVADVRVPAEVDALVGAHAAIDVLVANAGVYVGGDLWDSDPDALDELLRTNVNGVVRTVRAAVGPMRARGHGDILVTSSVSGHQAIHWEPVYSASKHALQAFVHGLRRQLAGSGVRAMAIAPGVVLNDLWGVSGAEEIDRRVAAGKGLRSEDVADAAAYMLTRPRHVTIRDLVILPREQPI